MLRGKQKRFLRSKAHNLKPIAQIGKEGLSSTWLQQIEEAIEKRELIKVNILQNSLVDEAEVQEFVENNSDIQVVQIIGHVLVMYRRASKPKYRKISEELAEI